MLDFPTPEFPVKADNFPAMKGGKARRMVNLVKTVRPVQIALVEQDDDLAGLEGRNGRHPVNEEGVGPGHRPGGDDHQLIDIGHRRPGKGIAPGQDLLHEALAAAQLPHLYPVADQWGDAFLPEFPPGPAGQQFGTGIDIIEPAQGLLNPSLCHMLTVIHENEVGPPWLWSRAPSKYTRTFSIPEPERVTRTWPSEYFTVSSYCGSSSFPTYTCT